VDKEEGGYENAAYHHSGSGKEEAQIEPTLLLQSLPESEPPREFWRPWCALGFVESVMCPGFRGVGGLESIGATRGAGGRRSVRSSPGTPPACAPGELTRAAERGLRRLDQDPLFFGLETFH
jgi:hypothetical protein